jgi:NDP-sugar pyrophosphorylase family protein
VIDAMVFAAGLGTRLRPLTDTVPKALIEVGGMSMLERTLRRIAELGPGTIVINAHHHARQLVAEVERVRRSLHEESASEAAGSDVDRGAARRRVPDLRLSLEADRALETGGGLRRAAGCLSSKRSVLLHNADVLSELSLEALVSTHDEFMARSEAGVAATLAVQDRPAGRKLLFDERGLFGRVRVAAGEIERAREPVGEVRELAFAGIHVVSPGLILTLPDEEVFSIVDHYLELAREGGTVLPFDMGSVGWWEIGTPERLVAAREAFGGSARSGGPASEADGAPAG